MYVHICLLVSRFTGEVYRRVARENSGDKYMKGRKERGVKLKEMDWKQSTREEREGEKKRERERERERVGGGDGEIEKACNDGMSFP